MALYKRTMLPSRTFSPVGVFTPSLLASRVFFSVVGSFAGPLLFSVFLLPFAMVVEEGIFSVESFVGIIGDTAFPALVAVEVAVVVVAVLLVDVSGFLCPATSFFHFRTVSFAKSATLLSSCVRNLPTTIPSFVD